MAEKLRLSVAADLMLIDRKVTVLVYCIRQKKIRNKS